MINVLFLCLGNICRSPMAEAILRHELKEEGLDSQVEVDSAGTGDYHIGNSPHEGTITKLDEYGISSEHLAARQVNASDIKNFDYIITMDESNGSRLEEMFDLTSSSTVVCRMMDFVDDAKEANVPDPYFTGDFDYTYELISGACQDFLAYLKEKHHIKG